MSTDSRKARDEATRDSGETRNGTGPADGGARTGEGISRRRLIGGAGAAGAAGLVLGAAGGAAGYAATRPDEPAALTTVGSTEVMFHGKHQPGITTPLQARGHLVAFDLVPGAGRKEAIALMRRWSATAGRLMTGEPAGNGAADGPDHDTGIALDAGPSSLTVTFGFGRTFFERTGLTDRRPRGSTRCRPSPRTTSTPRAPTVISGFRSARTTRSSPSTRCVPCRRRRPRPPGSAGR